MHPTLGHPTFCLAATGTGQSFASHATISFPATSNTVHKRTCSKYSYLPGIVVHFPLDPILPSSPIWGKRVALRFRSLVVDLIVSEEPRD